jgi:hypothetical protein
MQSTKTNIFNKRNFHKTDKTYGNIPNNTSHHDNNYMFPLSNIQCACKLSEYFAKPCFHKYWSEIHDVTTISKRKICRFILTLNAFDKCPSCDTALAIMVVSLEVVGRKHCPWRIPTWRNHTLSGLANGVVDWQTGTAAMELPLRVHLGLKLASPLCAAK